MAVQTRCPNPSCHKALTVAPEHLGQAVRCKHCGTTFVVADPTRSVEAARRSVAEPRKTQPLSETSRAPASASTTGGATLSTPSAGTPRQIGRFAVRARLGEGAFGTVYRAYDPQLDREVALKVAKSGALSTPLRVERFLREARAAAQLRHPHIVPVHDAGRDGELYYIASAFVRGRTLEHAAEAGPPDFRRAAQVVRQLAEALAYAHGLGIVHRDVKPANTLVDERGDVHLMDFGLAHRGDTEEKLTQDGAILGTPSYMSPEQASGRSGAALPASDQYSLGVVLYDLLCGQTPFSGPPEVQIFHHLQTEPPPPRQVRPEVPRDLETVCLKALAKKPEERYPSCQALADDLRRWLDGEPILARRLGPLERLQRWRRREPALAAAVGLALAALVAITLLAVNFGLYRSRVANDLRLEQQKTQDALVEAQAQRDLARRQQQQTQLALANMALDRALGLCARGEVGHGLLWLFRSLELTPAEAPELQRAIRVNLAGWRCELPVLKAALPHPVARGRAVALSRDGKVVLTGGPDGTTRLWDAATGKPLGPTTRQPGPVSAVAFSPDGRTVLTGGEDGLVRRWNAASGQPLSAPLPFAGEILALASSPDGKTILATSRGNGGRLWDAVTGQPIGAPLPHGRSVLAAAFSPDGRIALTGGYGGDVRLWEASTGKPLGPPLQHDGAVYSATFTPDGKAVVVGTTGGSTGGKVSFWDAATGQALTRPWPAQTELAAVAVSPDGRTLLTGSFNQTARLWDAATGEPLGPPLQHQHMVMAVAFGPDGRTLLTGSADNRGRDGSARLWEVAPAKALGPPLPHEGTVSAVAYRPHPGPTVVTGAEDGTARVWDVATGQPVGEVMRFHDRTGPVPLALSPDGQTILTRGGPNAAQLWNATTGKPAGPPLQHQGYVRVVAFSPDGKTALTGSQDNSARLWDVATGRPLGPPLSHNSWIFSVAFSPDGKTVLTGSEDNTARLWDASTGQALGRVLKHNDAVARVAFSPDGRTIVTASFDSTARLWEAATGQALGSPLQHRGTVMAAEFSPDGRAVLTGSTDGTARLWDAATGQPRSPPWHGAAGPAAFSPDGNMILMGEAAQLWDVATGKPLGPPFRPQGGVAAAAFGPDGRTVLTGGTDRTARLWGVPSPESGDVQRLLLWTQLLVGMELGPDGTVHALDAPAWRQLYARVEQAGGPPRP